MRERVVAYRYDYYPYVRNIVGIIQGIQYIKSKDAFGRLNAGAHWLNRIFRRELISTFDLNNQFYDFNLNQFDILHLFNGVNYGRVPWVSTFETVLPRFSAALKVSRGEFIGGISHSKLKYALDAIAGEHCKQIIALSGNTA